LITEPGLETDSTEFSNGDIECTLFMGIALGGM